MASLRVHCLIFLASMFVSLGLGSDYRERSDVDGTPYDSMPIPDSYGETAKRSEPEAPDALPDSFEPYRLPSKRRSEPVGKVNVKNLGKYTFITKYMGNNKYSCLCKKGSVKVWAGMCGVTDKNFNYRYCV